MPQIGPTLAIRVSGPIACFTAPEFKAERVSYPVITPSAARGILEAVFWKPAIRWRIDRIKVLSSVRWIAFRRNEINSRAATPSTATVERGGAAPVLIVEADRAQRNTVALRDVDYVIEAHFELTHRAGPEESIRKFVEMFQRRLHKGQHYHQAYLGCREFPADVEPVTDDVPAPINHSQDFGLMLWDIEFSKQRNRARFFRARMKHGVIDVPAEPVGVLPGEEGAAS